jgi:hypothetical protein
MEHQWNETNRGKLDHDLHSGYTGKNGITKDYEPILQNMQAYKQVAQRWEDT